MEDAQGIGDLPDELVLNPSRLKWVMVFLIGATFSVAGGFMVSDGELLNGLFVSIFFGICAVVALMMLKQNSSQLRLNRDGFVERTLFGRENAQRWTDVSEFSVFDVTVTKSMVVYEPRVVEGGAGTQALAKVARTLTGGKAHGISDTYGMSAEDLAALMNEFRVRAMRAKLDRPQQD